MQYGPAPDALELARAARSNAVLLVEDFAPAGVYLQRQPAMLIIGRRVKSSHDLQPVRAWRAGVEPRAAARQWFEHRLQGVIRAHPQVQAWQALAEPEVDVRWGVGDKPEAVARAEKDSLAAMRWFTTAQIELAQLIRAAGAQPVIGGFAAGTPGQSADHINEMWTVFLPALEDIARRGGYVALTELTTMHPDWTEWLQYRYRRLLRVARTANLHPQVLLTVASGTTPDGGQPPRVHYPDALTYARMLKRYVDGVNEPNVVAVFAARFGDRRPEQATAVLDGWGFPAAWLRANAGQLQPLPPATTTVPKPGTSSLLLPGRYRVRGDEVHPTGPVGVRLFPWLHAQIVPPVMRLLNAGESVEVLAVVRPQGLDRFGWGLIGPAGNEWVNMSALEAETA